MTQGILGFESHRDDASERELVSTCAIVNALIERPASGLVAFDRELRVEFSSPELIDVLGDIVRGRPLQSETEPVAAVVGLVARVRETGEPMFEVNVGAGPRAELVASAYPIKARGEVVGVGCVLENSARERETAELLDTTTLAIGVFEGPEHRVRLLNRSWRDQLAVTGSVGMRLRELATSAFGEGVFASLDHAYATHEHVHFHELVLRAAAAGGERDRLYTGIIAPVRTALGAVRGVMMICAEASEGVLARQQRLASPPLVWSGPCGAAADYASDGSATPARLVGVHVDDRARCALALAETTRLQAPSSAEVRMLQPDGSYRWHHVHFSLDPHGDRWYATATDDQDARELAQRAHRTAENDRRVDARARDQFLASVSHELRAPITTILLWEKVLRDVPDDVGLRDRALAAIHQSALTQARLVDDLLDISRAISGKLRVDLRPLEIGAVLAAAIADEEPSARAKSQRIERAIAPHLGQVSGDLARLRQVLHNLISNAIKFTGEGGTIRVSARRDGRRVSIEIADSGRGIAREFLPRIFEPFSQADDALALSLAHEGLGLGLAISYQLVVAHAGQLSASSPGLGHGSTFSLSLPVLAHREATPPPIAPASRLSGLRLLLVDDDRRVLDALQVLLQAAGATVDVADSVALGFGTLERTPPDVVLSDLAMPDEDGYSFVQRIRTLSGSASHVPTVAITGHATEADRDRALAAGFDLYVTKPVNVDHLIATIARLVETKRSGSAPDLRIT